MTQREEGPGPRVRSPWAKHPVGQWELVRRLDEGDPGTLSTVAHAAQVWAWRHGLRGEYRIRDEGRTLWVRFTERGAACDEPDCDQQVPCAEHQWSGKGARKQ